MTSPRGCGLPLKSIADKHGARVKVVEIPPGPPVLSTLVAEIYGPDYERQRQIAQQVLKIFEDTPEVVDSDWYMEKGQVRMSLEVDKEKAALHGITRFPDRSGPPACPSGNAGRASSSTPGKRGRQHRAPIPSVR